MRSALAQLVDIPSSDGKVILHGAVYKPPSAIFGKGPFPLMVAVYGGPGVQRVTNDWNLTADLRAQHLCLKGYAVLKLDNRGSIRRGHAFEAPLHKNMGSIELEDQLAGVEWAIGQGLAIRSRVAIMGWSYGGYMSAMALVKQPKVWKAAIAGAPGWAAPLELIVVSLHSETSESIARLMCAVRPRPASYVLGRLRHALY